MPSFARALVDTPIGPIGLAWSAAGIAGLQLPESDPDATLRTLRRRFPDAVDAPPVGAVLAVIGLIRAQLAGESADDLSGIAIDLSRSAPFERRVYEAARAIPPGSTVTYGELALAIGEPDAARAVGRALGRNPVPIIVPCHRILAAGGRTGGFTAPGGTLTKMRLLAIEGAAGPGGQLALL